MKQPFPFLFVFVSLLAITPALAVEPDEMLKNPALETRARALSKELRCLVCQGEAIDESNADFARDLRRLVRERLQAGESDEAVRQFLRKRYGDFILLKPPAENKNIPLWLAPLAVFGLGLAAAGVFIRRHSSGRE